MQTENIFMITLQGFFIFIQIIHLLHNICTTDTHTIKLKVVEDSVRQLHTKLDI
jgi:hypothetical protein